MIHDHAIGMCAPRGGVDEGCSWHCLVPVQTRSGTSRYLRAGVISSAQFNQVEAKALSKRPISALPSQASGRNCVQAAGFVSGHQHPLDSASTRVVPAWQSGRAEVLRRIGATEVRYQPSVLFLPSTKRSLFCDTVCLLPRSHTLLPS
jgi:hypothetical protein